MPDTLTAALDPEALRARAAEAAATVSKAADGAADAAGKAWSYANDVAGQAKRAYDDMSGNSFNEKLGGMIAAQPLLCLVGAFAAGYIAARLLED